MPETSPSSSWNQLTSQLALSCVVERKFSFEFGKHEQVRKKTFNARSEGNLSEQTWSQIIHSRQTDAFCIEVSLWLTVASRWVRVVVCLGWDGGETDLTVSPHQSHRQWDTNRPPCSMCTANKIPFSPQICQIFTPNTPKRYCCNLLLFFGWRCQDGMNTGSEEIIYNRCTFSYDTWHWMLVNVLKDSPFCVTELVLRKWTRNICSLCSSQMYNINYRITL